MATKSLSCSRFAQENEIKRFALLLWPQNTGHLTLPSLEIRPFSASRKQSEGRLGSEQPIASCELDYQNAGETILVVPDVQSTTVSLDSNGAGGGWLVESRSRPP